MEEVHEEGWLALDIGAKSHAWACDLDGHGEAGTVDNTPAELHTLLAACTGRVRHLRVLVEATGVYYLDVALLAHALGAAVMVVNPRVAHHFAQALNQRNKTDKLDAKMLLECLRRMPFRAWQPPRESWLQLRDYGRFLVQLTEAGTAARNRLHALSSTRTSPAFLITELKRMLAGNDRRIARVRAKAVALIRTDPYLQQRFEALCTIQGVAETSAVSLLSELVTLPPTLSSRACVCHAGLDPRVFESGTSVHKAPRISHRGNKYLRRALFHPALSAATHDPGAHAFKQRLIDRGKKKMQANVAIMRKLLTAAWAIMKDPQPYDTHRLYPTLKNA
ncbi:MAG TPA: IS110 family transposase [Rhodanobacteraceae bacterium]|nr:IS110 family transposase [Rhodanobacteraceae bacterium]